MGRLRASASGLDRQCGVDGGEAKKESTGGLKGNRSSRLIGALVFDRCTRTAGAINVCRDALY